MEAIAAIDSGALGSVCGGLTPKQAKAVEATMKWITEDVGANWRPWGKGWPTTFTVHQPGAGSSIVHFNDEGLIAGGMGRPL